jgi:hypothetical protein
MSRAALGELSDKGLYDIFQVSRPDAATAAAASAMRLLA